MMQNEVKLISLIQFFNFYFVSIGKYFYYFIFLYDKFFIFKLMGGKVYFKFNREILNFMDSLFFFFLEF